MSKRPTPVAVPTAEYAKLTRVEDLGPEGQELVKQLLVEGATFEDVADTVKGPGDKGITLAAVRNFFRSNLQVQTERVKHSMEVAAQLQAAVGNPNSAEAQLAQAVMLTGYLCTTREGSDISLKDAERSRVMREHLKSAQRISRLHERETAAKIELLRQRIRFEKNRNEGLKGHLAKLQMAVNADGSGQKLSPEAYRQIQELYGLLHETPPPGAEVENSQVGN